MAEISEQRQLQQQQANETIRLSSQLQGKQSVLNLTLSILNLMLVCAW